MAHFSKLDDNNVVTQVVVVNNEVITDENGVEQEQLGVDFLRNLYKEPNAAWKQTSYNLNFRINFGGVGSTYDSEKDAFIAPQPFPSWSLNNSTCKWEAPIPYPSDGERYVWVEEAYQADNTTGWQLLG